MPGKKRQKQHPQGKRHRGKKLLNATLTIMSIAAFAVTMLTLFPRLSVSNSSAIDPNDPFSTPFLISNDGYVPLFSVEFSLAIREVKNKVGGGIFGNSKYGLRMTKPDAKVDIFGPSDVYSLYAGQFIRAPAMFNSADIAIVIQSPVWISI